jgi:aspartate/methionine/tyrosine aminotransferase
LTTPRKRPEGSLISYFSNRVKKEGGINLAQGTPGFPPPAPLLQLLEQNAQDPRFHQYAPGTGNFDLLELIRQNLAATAPVDLDNLLIVQGATEGIFLTFFYLTTILERPYSVLSFDPVYESYPILADMFRVPFVYGDLEPGQSVDFQRLEQQVKEHNVKIVFIASPGNPLGKVWNRREMEQMVELSRKYKFYILFDAVYKDIYFGDEPFNPLVLNDSRLFYIDSFSKTLSITGWRIGYIVTPKDHMVKIRDMHDYTGLCAPSILQVAIARYLEQSGYGKDYIETVKRKCEASCRYLTGVLERERFDVAAIEGGYFLWAKLPQPLNDALQFAEDLYDSVKIGVVPGENFSRTKTQFIRVNIAAEMPVIRDAAGRLQRFFERDRQ